MTKRKLADIEEDKRQAISHLEKLDEERRHLNNFELDIEELYGRAQSSLGRLDFLNLSHHDALNLQETLSRLTKGQAMIYSDIDQARERNRRQERQVEDRLDQLSREYSLRSEDEKERKNYGN
ncbi:hypothetical protein [Streptococcus oricebi]|uniref:Cingulin n=1 Tax=Streptococcus oricebi TaxID=1547447 RepID=A0ABS5B197_9STRE|nr:hypothetical protein [Streptococcus oricebi]MBP2622606.1 hypothetical protein [Streptococcus oricebi]